jgi:hypothetical protein
VRDAIWEEWIRKFFTFPNNQEKTKETMGTCFKNFKGTLYKNFILEDKELNWDGDEYAI